jgi:Zn-dependent peptidase ImmA (M78 family)
MNVTTTSEMIGANIKAAREDAGLSLRELDGLIEEADRVDGLSYSAIQRIESGQRKVASHELAELAEVLGTTMSRLLGRRERSASLALAGRITEEVSAESLTALRQRVVEILESSDLLDRLSGPRIPAKIPSLPAVAASRAGGRSLAAAARVALGLGVAPIANLAELVESRFGAHVVHQPLGTGQHGFCVTGEGIAVIIVNSGDVWGRQRFTLAHELCHLIVGDLDSWELIDGRSNARPGEEGRADDFAAHFLTPDQGIQEMVGAKVLDKAGVMRVALAFGVSRETAANRLRDLGLISTSLCDAAKNASAGELAQRAGLAAAYEETLAKQNRTTPPGFLTERALDAFDQGEVGLGLVARVVGDEYFQDLRPQLLAKTK